MSKNYGLLIESRNPTKKLNLLNNEGALNISLLDYFDGFNQFYLFNEEWVSDTDSKDWNYNLLNVDSYIIDSVTSTNHISYAIIYQTHYLLLFYSRNNLMQVSSCFE